MPRGKTGGMPPQITGEEPPPEMLTAGDPQTVEMPSTHHDRVRVTALRTGFHDLQLVTQGPGDRQSDQDAPGT